MSNELEEEVYDDGYTSGFRDGKQKAQLEFQRSSEHFNVSASPEYRALESERDLLRNALDECLSVMDMQEKRESGEFHIPGESFFSIWCRAKSKARALLNKKST